MMNQVNRAMEDVSNGTSGLKVLRGRWRRTGGFLGGLMLLAATTLATAPARAETASGVLTANGLAPITFADVVDKVRGAVVSIYVESGQGGFGDANGPDALPDLPDDNPLKDFFKKFGKKFQAPGGQPPSQAQGSGFIVSADGYVVTNNHVVADASKVEISFDEVNKIAAKVIGKDARTDLALLKIEPSKPLQFVPFTKKPIRVGDWVLAIGNPFGLGGTVTAGIISARGRDIGSGPYDYLQIDAAVNRGNSGGPAFNLDGEVVGVNSAIFSPSGGNVGIAFAVPADLAAQVIAQLKAKGEVSRGWLGVNIQNITDDISQSMGLEKAAGALITKITENGPAAKSTIAVGDAVIAVNGEAVESSRDLARKIAGLSPDAEARLTVFRNGKTLDVQVKLGVFPANGDIASAEPAPKTPEAPPVLADGQKIADLGLSLTVAVAGAKPGVTISAIEPNSEAADKGLAAGDVIIEVAGEVVEKPDDVVKGVEGAKTRGRKAVLFRVKGNQGERFVALALKTP